MKLRLVLNRDGSVARVETQKGDHIEGVEAVTSKTPARGRHKVTLEFIPGSVETRVEPE